VLTLTAIAAYVASACHQRDTCQDTTGSASLSSSRSQHKPQTAQTNSHFSGASELTVCPQKVLE